MTYIETLDQQLAASAALTTFVDAIRAALPVGVTLTHTNTQWTLQKGAANIIVQPEQLARELGVVK